MTTNLLTHVTLTMSLTTFRNYVPFWKKNSTQLTNALKFAASDNADNTINAGKLKTFNFYEETGYYSAALGYAPAAIRLSLIGLDPTKSVVPCVLMCISFATY